MGNGDLKTALSLERRDTNAPCNRLRKLNRAACKCNSEAVPLDRKIADAGGFVEANAACMAPFHVATASCAPCSESNGGEHSVSQQYSL